jgi:hypothetical protein
VNLVKLNVSANQLISIPKEYEGESRREQERE